MEYIRVVFEEKRRVCIDGHPSGSTNDVLAVNEGPHSITLSGPADFTPSVQEPEVTGTNEISPMEIRFEKL